MDKVTDKILKDDSLTYVNSISEIIGNRVTYQHI